MEKNYKLLDLFSVLFVTLLLLSNVIASKVVDWMGITGTAAMYIFPLTYIFGDILVEVYGYARSRRIIWMGFMANILMILIFWYAIVLPFPDYYKGQEAFAAVLGSVPRMVIVSILGFWVGSFTNAFVLARMKEWMVKWDPNHKFLFLRTIGSTIAGEFVDSCIFITGAFIFILPTKTVFTMLFIQWIVKCVVEVVMTPITYVVCNKIKRYEGIDVVGSKTYNPFKAEK